MKIAVLSESPADEAAIRVIVEALLQQGVDIESARIRAGGFHSLLKTLPAIIKHMHFHTDAEGVVVVLDSDLSPIHSATHDGIENQYSDCRLCQVRTIINDTKRYSGRSTNWQPT